MISLILYFIYTRTKDQDIKDSIGYAFFLYALAIDFIAPPVIGKYYNLSDTLTVILMILSTTGFLILFNTLTKKEKK